MKAVRWRTRRVSLLVLSAAFGAVVLLATAAFAAPDASWRVIERVSLDSAGNQANGLSFGAHVSEDGRFVTFTSRAANLVPGDTNGEEDGFLRDRQTGLTERVTVSDTGLQANGQSGAFVASADGRFVLFASNAANLVAGDTNGTWDIFVRDRLLGTTERVSVSSAGVQGNGSSQVYAAATMTLDGRYVVFHSAASNLVAGDTNGVVDVFARDRTAGTTERVSVSSVGVQGNALSWNGGISSDGRYVGFTSEASNLVAGDTNGASDMFVRDRAAGTTERMSVGSGGVQGNGGSGYAAVSGDGRFVAFNSDATNFTAGDTNGVRDVFVHDRVSGTTELVTVNGTGVPANGMSLIYPGPGNLSADGRLVVFYSDASDIVTGDTNGVRDVFIRDRVAGTTVRVLSLAGVQGNADSTEAAISANGRIVAFISDATNLVPGDTNGALDVFVTGAPDSTPPTVTCSVTPSLLWPANHRLVAVTAIVQVTDSESGPAGFTLVSVTSNEPDNGLGDGDTTDDIQGWTPGTTDVSGLLRAERSGAATGRAYTLTYKGADQAGNTATCTITVNVPHNKGR